jgi:hypothetical protein
MNKKTQKNIFIEVGEKLEKVNVKKYSKGKIIKVCYDCA